jgi:hypothetical protein
MSMHIANKLTSTCTQHLMFVMLMVLMCLTSFVTPAYSQAKSTTELATIKFVGYDDAPEYIQTRIKNIVLNCTEGTLTPNKAGVYEYKSGDGLSNYIIDFTAWAKHPIQSCTHSPNLCNDTGCTLYAYTQIEKNIFKQSLRAYVQRIGVASVQEKDLNGEIQNLSVIEYVQSKEKCRLINGGNAPCTMNFTWKDGKFTYYGIGRKEVDAIEPEHVVIPSDSPAVEDATQPTEEISAEDKPADTK